MSVRHYRPGDESAQVGIFNAAAAALPKFKPATVIEVQRRIRTREFDPRSRWYADVAGQIVGYGVIHGNGRISFPWCLPGHESQQEPLFEAMILELQSRQVARAFAAYRADWTPIVDFFAGHGFAPVREMVNYFVNFNDMPTPSNVLSSAVTPLTPADMSEMHALAPDTLRVHSAAELERWLFKNPYFPPESLFALRSKLDRRVLAVGNFVREPTYADPEAIDPLAPCFRLGAFGAEGMQTKRVNGLFSFIARADRSLSGFGLELMGEAAGRVDDHDALNGLAAQVPSDSPALLEFYHKYFRRQGSFPIYERTL